LVALKAVLLVAQLVATMDFSMAVTKAASRDVRMAVLKAA
jgi:hypothetical protein